MLKNKLIHLLLAVLVLIAAVPLGAAAAFAAEQEQVVKVQIGAGSFDIWQHSNGEWQNTDGIPGRDEPGQDKTPTFDYTANELLNKYTLTRVEITHNVTPDDFNTPANAAKDFVLALPGKGKTWDEYHRNYMQYYSNNYSAGKAKDGEDLARGRVTTQFKLNLSPTNTNRALDLKDPETRKELGMTDRDFSQMAQGWRWYMPVKITWYGIPKTEINLVASNIDPGVPGEAEPGKTYTGTVKFKYFGTTPVENVPIGAFNGQYRATLKKNGQPVTSDNFAPGDVKTYTFTWTAPESGQTVLKGVIDTPPLPNVYQETTEEDNTVQITVFVKQPPQQSGPGSLTFQAVSQDRSKSRPVNTAKWTDWVTATLKPPAPTPPRGSLDSWEITSAKLTYPKKNPNFTFGTPYGPVGTKTINMTPGGHEAKVEFQEDWAMDGAKIYSLIERRLMAEKPKNYTITASYTVEFKYKYREKKTDSEGNTYYVTRYGTGSDSGTVTGQLLVNDTGVNSLAQ
ncbi:hypothetical protein IT084_06645 [Desulfallas sp. Bu1-1]|uniref:hypothetical protein n=1 Tax=Desulfallas sp. Bu1-1 TaxID=2787620 RepID=UPI00189CC9DC|nr:hypothetical protein [Desulfallas sp. Bu1-1]MBF7082654.1 hypothetical protein [Desulfallas sp. Bu1-1]